MTGFSWPDTLAALVAGEVLDEQTCRMAMTEIMAGEATSAQIAAFAVALRAKGETAGEVVGLVSAMLDAATPLTIDGPAVDIVGTGGDGSHSVNISTFAAIVAAASGARVIKHGNRAATSRCGSADVLEALGVRIELDAEGVRSTVSELGIGFAFAPMFHPALRHAGPTRKELGIPTVFNILGPLANPAQPAASVIGAANERLAPVMAQVFVNQGRYAAVVRGTDGLDEITVGGDTEVWEGVGGQVCTETISPASVGWELGDAGQLRGGDAAANAAVARGLFAGQRDGALAVIRQAVVLNAAAGLVAVDAVAGADGLESASDGIPSGGGTRVGSDRGVRSAAATGPRFGSISQPFAQRLAAAVPVAEDAIDSGRAAQLLADWVELSQRLP